MNSSKLLRVGMPVLGVCFLAALQSGCKSEVMSDRPSVPPAEKEMLQEENDLSKDIKVKKADEFAVAAKNAKSKKDFEYPVFEDTDRTPIYSKTDAKKSSSSTSASGSVYIVRRGDSLGKIAARYRVKTADLAKANNLQLNSVIRIGQKLIIPGAKAVSKNTSAKKSDSATVGKNTVSRSGLYVVRKGDSISKIASRCKVKSADLMAANNLTEKSVLRIGQTLKLPGAKVVDEESVVVEQQDISVVKPESEEKVEADSKKETSVSGDESDVAKELGDNPPAESAVAVKDEKNTAAAVDLNSAPTTVQQEMHIDEFCKNHNIDKAVLLKLNSGLDENSVLKKNTAIVIPMD